MAFGAMGDKDTAKVGFKYLPKVQVKSSTPGVGSGNSDGWFLQKTHRDGLSVLAKLRPGSTSRDLG